MHETILTIDGSRETLELAGRILRNERYDVEVANSAEQALALLQGLRPRLILTDMRLPGGMDAMELVRRLRSAASTRSVAIVMVTTDASEAERTAALAAGCDDFISRPLTAAMLRELAAYWVSRDPAAGRLSPSGRGWMRRLFKPARRKEAVRQLPTYRAGTRLPPGEHFAPLWRRH